MTDQFLAPEPISAGGNLPEKWKRYKRTFDLFLVATGRAEATDPVKVALLLRTIGIRGESIYESFTWTDQAHKQDFPRVVAKFEAFCTPRVNLVAQTHKLLTLRQGSMNIDEYVTELHSIARDCDLGEKYDRLMLHSLILGINSDRTRRRMFEKEDLTLENAIKLCRAHETTTMDLKAVAEAAAEVHAVYGQPNKQKKIQKGHQTNKTNEKIQKGHQTNKTNEMIHKGQSSQPGQASSCGNCGRAHPPRQCPAYGQVCSACRKHNHFARCCRSKRQPAVQSAHLVEEGSDSGSESAESLYHVAVSRRDKKVLADLTLETPGGKKLQTVMQVDTAATCNVLTGKDYQNLGAPPVQPTKVKLNMYNDTQIKPLGTLKLKVAENGETLKFYVVDQLQPKHSLLSAQSCLDMGLISLTESVHLVTPQEDLLKEFEDVFKGVGTLPGEYNIELDPTVRPVKERPRKFPIAMRAEMKAKLEEMEGKKLIAKVSEPTEWISNAVPVRKKSGALRCCIDPRNLNKAIKRNHHIMPNIEDVLPELNKAKFFSLCDAKDGFLQVMLTPEATDLTTFWTPCGRYKWLRLPFGLSSSPEEFQRRLTETLDGLRGVQVVADDILIYGQSREEHDQNLREFFKRARKTSLKLNKAKCQFLKTELPYIGHVLTQNGVKPDPAKVAAIKQMPRPTCNEGVRRFLGHVNYMGRFLPNLSAETEPLRRLLTNKESFVWSEVQEDAYQKVLRMLSAEDTLQYFDREKPVTIQTDASTCGLGAVLIQEDRPVAYVSRSLMDAEKRYAPIELECLAIVFATRKFDQFVFGHPNVTVQTDHKPLESILRRSLLAAPKRLQTMMLVLQRYQLSVMWRPGAEQVTADLLSRSPLPSSARNESHRDLDIDEQIFSMIADVTIKSDPPLLDPTMDLIRQATIADDELVAVKQAIRQNWPPGSPELWKRYRCDLVEDNGLIIKANRVVVPAGLRRKFLALVHGAHQGLESTLRRARRAVFWPGIKKDIESHVGACTSCATDAPENRRDVLHNHSVPDTPWTKLGADYLSHKGRDYLVIVDYHSNYLEFEEVNPATSENTIEVFKRAFVRLGVPICLQTDNGPQFSARQFAKFADKWSFNHTTSAAEHSPSNGKAESAVKIVKRCLKRGEDPYLAWMEYLNTPPAGAQESPIERLLGRNPRTLLPTLSDNQPSRPPLAGWNRKLSVNKSFNRNTRPLSSLTVG